MRSGNKSIVSLIVLTAMILSSFGVLLTVSPQGEPNRVSSASQPNLKSDDTSDQSRAWGGDEHNTLWVRSDMRSNESYYYMDVESRIQVPGEPNTPAKDNAEVNISHNSESLAVQFRYPKLSSSTPLINSQYLSNIEPHVVLYVNSQYKAGRTIDISLSFDMQGDGTYDYVADFNNYTTKRNRTCEKAVFNFEGWRGGSAPSGSMTNGVVLLKVWRVDNLPEAKTEPPFQIYCGFYNKTSWVGIPFNVPDVMPKADLFEKGDGPDTLGFTWDGQDPVYFDMPITFDASNSSDPDSSTIYYQWRFGDGSLPTSWSTTPKVTHTYVAPFAEKDNKSYNANYTVTLTVKDPDDHYSSVSLVCHVMTFPNFVPTIDLMAADVPNGVAVVNQLVTFTSQASDRDDDDDTLEYKWDFGDGDSTDWTSYSSSGEKAAHAYSLAGKFTVTLRVRDPSHAIATKTLAITVEENEAPTAVINITSDNVNTNLKPGYGVVNVGEVFTVDASQSTDSDGIPQIFEDGKWQHYLMYKWETGDGRTTDQTPVDHDGDGDPTNEVNYNGDGWVTYPTFSFNYTTVPPGSVYTITLHVRDGPPESELTKESTAEYKMWVNQEPTASFTYHDKNGTDPADGFENGMEITFDATASVDPDPYDAGHLSYYWDFGDGNVDGGLGSAVVKHKYNLQFAQTEKEKIMQVKLTVVDSMNARSVQTLNIKIIPTNKPPVAKGSANGLEVDEVTVSTYQDVIFDGSESYDQDLYGGAIAHWYWDVDTAVDSDNDGDPADDHDLTGENVTYKYTRPGTYTVNLIVIDNKGASNSLKDNGKMITIIVKNQPPKASIATVGGGKEFTTDDIITFTADGSIDPDGATPNSTGIVKYEWDFDGDGTVDEVTDNSTEAQHQYKKEGQYKVILTVYDSNGDTGSDDMTVYITKKKTETNNNNSIPGFEIALLLMAMLVSVVLASVPMRKKY